MTAWCVFARRPGVVVALPLAAAVRSSSRRRPGPTARPSRARRRPGGEHGPVASSGRSCSRVPAGRAPGRPDRADRPARTRAARRPALGAAVRAAAAVHLGLAGRPRRGRLAARGSGRGRVRPLGDGHRLGRVDSRDGRACPGSSSSCAAACPPSSANWRRTPSSCGPPAGCLWHVTLAALAGRDRGGGAVGRADDGGRDQRRGPHAGPHLRRGGQHPTRQPRSATPAGATRWAGPSPCQPRLGRRWSRAAIALAGPAGRPPRAGAASLGYRPAAAALARAGGACRLAGGLAAPASRRWRSCPSRAWPTAPASSAGGLVARRVGSPARAGPWRSNAGCWRAACSGRRRRGCSRRRWPLLRLLVGAGSAGFRGGLLVLAAVAWAMPGPVVGLGQKEVFRLIVDLDRCVHAPARAGCSGTAPRRCPVVLVHTVRMFPFAVADPLADGPPDPARAVRGGPARRPRPGAASCGRSSGRWPGGRACCRPSRSLVLSLGEISAAKIVSTPEAETFAEVVWTQMHYGVGPDLAARCLVLLAVVFAGAGLVAGASLSGPACVRM